MATAKKPFKLHKSKDEQYYVTITASNGETLNCSENMVQAQSAIKNLHSQARLWAKIYGVKPITVAELKLLIENKAK